MSRLYFICRFFYKKENISNRIGLPKFNIQCSVDRTDIEKQQSFPNTSYKTHLTENE